MEIRKISPDECIAAKKIETIAFLGGTDFSCAKEDPEKFQAGYENKRAAFNEEGKMCSTLTLFPFQFMLNGQSTGTGGIGGVATLPEERNKGCVRALLHNALEEMHETNMPLSYLYPFSHPYYRKFGYEFSYLTIKNIIPFEAFKHFANRGNVRFYMPGEDYSDIAAIYSSFIKNKNLAMVRSEEQWKNRLNIDPYKSNNYTYIWYDENGKAQAYIIAHSKPKEDFMADMEVRELIWLDNKALSGLFGFLGTFVPKYESFVFRAPSYLDTWLIFPEPYEIKKEFEHGGMSRIVDAGKILELGSIPPGKGTFSIGVRDDFLSWNNGVYTIEWEDGKLAVNKTAEKPDLHCSIQTLAQLAVGFTDVYSYSSGPDFVLNGNQNIAELLFPKRLLFLNDFF